MSLTRRQARILFIIRCLAAAIAIFAISVIVTGCDCKANDRTLWGSSACTIEDTNQ